jgi:sestrin
MRQGFLKGALIMDEVVRRELLEEKLAVLSADEALRNDQLPCIARLLAEPALLPGLRDQLARFVESHELASLLPMPRGPSRFHLVQSPPGCCLLSSGAAEAGVVNEEGDDAGDEDEDEACDRRVLRGLFESVMVRQDASSMGASHLLQMMSFHPRYVERHLATMTAIMSGTGPLSPCWKNYLAIMAASRHNCLYLISEQQNEFLFNGGDVEWLRGGLAAAPTKLAALNTLNAILAHQPWTLTPTHVGDLMSGDDAWSATELVQALVVLCTFHSLSSFAWGMGLQLEVDSEFSIATTAVAGSVNSGGGGGSAGGVGDHREGKVDVGGALSGGAMENRAVGEVAAGTTDTVRAAGTAGTAVVAADAGDAGDAGAGGDGGDGGGGEGDEDEDCDDTEIEQRLLAITTDGDRIDALLGEQDDDEQGRTMVFERTETIRGVGGACVRKGSQVSVGEPTDDGLENVDAVICSEAKPPPVPLGGAIDGGKGGGGEEGFAPGGDVYDVLSNRYVRRFCRIDYPEESVRAPCDATDEFGSVLGAAAAGSAVTTETSRTEGKASGMRVEEGAPAAVTDGREDCDTAPGLATGVNGVKGTLSASTETGSEDNIATEAMTEAGSVAAQREAAEATGSTAGTASAAAMLQYEDFDVKSKDYTIFRSSDFNWKDHGFALVSRFLGDVAPLLDEQFDLIYFLTYNTFSSKTDIDTQPMRGAVWHYVQRVFGMCNDDYDYREVNTFVNRPIKMYVKKSACFPETVTARDFASFSSLLKDSEKCHISLLAIEARKQVHYLLMARID